MIDGYEKRIYKCTQCGEFEVDSLKYSECQCGKNKMKLSYSYGYSYDRTDIVKGWYQKENKIYYNDYKVIEKYAFPFYKMTNLQEKLYNRIKKLGSRKVCEIHISEDYETLQDSSKQLSRINASITGINMHYENGFQYGDNERNEVSMAIYFDRRTNEKEVTKSLARFYLILYMIKGGKINLNSIKCRDVLKSVAYDVSRTQKEIYDYEFYC